jgi:hypothetical protein
LFAACRAEVVKPLASEIIFSRSLTSSSAW